jgi:apolipoprotein D and lipocalin family protein
VTATYTILPDGEIEVINRCREADGTMKEATGRARRQDPDGPPTKLEVRFAPAFLSFLPMVWGDYWIIQLAEDYSWSVIGGPTREYLWILVRTTTLTPEIFAGISARLREQGYDPDRLVRTTHGK